MTAPQPDPATLVLRRAAVSVPLLAYKLADPDSREAQVIAAQDQGRASLSEFVGAPVLDPFVSYVLRQQLPEPGTPDEALGSTYWLDVLTFINPAYLPSNSQATQRIGE